MIDFALVVPQTDKATDSMLLNTNLFRTTALLLVKVIKLWNYWLINYC